MRFIAKIILKVLVGLVSVVIAVPINNLLFEAFVKPNTAELKIENTANFIIQSAQIGLCDDNQSVSLLEPGKSASVVFDNFGDCHYSIRLTFENGKSLESEFGYITSGSNYIDKVTVADNKVVVGQQFIESDRNYISKTVLLFASYFLIVFLLYQGAFVFIGRLAKRRPSN